MGRMDWVIMDSRTAPSGAPGSETVTGTFQSERASRWES